MVDGLAKTKFLLDAELGINYTNDEIHKALQKLHERYEVWNNLMSNPQVYIDKCTKKASARDSVWARLCKEDERVKWYVREGERAYDDLEIIFDGGEDFVLPPIPVVPTPPRGRTLVDHESPIRPHLGMNNIDGPPPTLQNSPGLRVISEEEYTCSVSAKKLKNKKRLFTIPNSPISSVGSSTNPTGSTFERIISKFDKSG